MRSSGILYPVSSLPSKYGIGCFSKEAYDFIDFLADAGQTFWQVLPMGVTGFGDSPYQSVSTFAGNPYFISLETLVEEGLLRWDECNSVSWGNDPERVDYGALFKNRSKILKIAFERFREQVLDQTEKPDTLESISIDPDTGSQIRVDLQEEAQKKSGASEKEGSEADRYQEFLLKNKDWLPDFAMFSALKDAQNQQEWSSWDLQYRNRDTRALAAASELLKDEIEFYCFQQYEFMKQWNRLHAYARSRHIYIIGDLPLYVAFDSADTWSHPELFQFDEQNEPTCVSGCAPDAFSPTGQLWGNPIYRWSAMAADGYSWWMRRLERNYEFYDVIRLDHFCGLDEYYSVPYGDETAENGTMEKGPAMDFFRVLHQRFPSGKMIVEDLGTLTDSVRKLQRDSGFPGMKILQYAFDDTERSLYLPYQYEKRSVAYTGNHDNHTMLGWVKSASDHDRDFARRYVNSIFTDYGQLVWDLIREVHRSVSETCIVPIQDYLVKDDTARINVPGTMGNNWQWRMAPGMLSAELQQSIRRLTGLYGRIPDFKTREAWLAAPANPPEIDDWKTEDGEEAPIVGVNANQIQSVSVEKPKLDASGLPETESEPIHEEIEKEAAQAAAARDAEGLNPFE